MCGGSCIKATQKRPEILSISDLIEVRQQVKRKRASQRANTGSHSWVGSDHSGRITARPPQTTHLYSHSYVRRRCEASHSGSNLAACAQTYIHSYSASQTSRPQRSMLAISDSRAETLPLRNKWAMKIQLGPCTYGVTQQ